MTTKLWAIVLLFIFLALSAIVPHFSFICIVLLIVLYKWDKRTTTPENYDYNESSLDLPLEYRYTHKHDYMWSSQWKERKKFIHQRDRVCQMCGSNSSLEVHHITYERLWYENSEDLVLLCRHCHQNVHDRHGYGKHGYFPIGR